MLRIIDIAEQPCHVICQIEPLTYAVISIRFEVECPSAVDVMPFHWLAEWGKKPPLDVRLNAITGQFESVQIILQDELIADIADGTKEHGKHSRKIGVPIFERVPWGRGPDDTNRRYVSERLDVKLAWTAEHEISVRLGSDSTALETEYRIDDSLSLLMNSNAYLTGFYLSGITPKDRELLRQAKLTV